MNSTISPSLIKSFSLLPFESIQQAVMQQGLLLVLATFVNTFTVHVLGITLYAGIFIVPLLFLLLFSRQKQQGLQKALFILQVNVILICILMAYILLVLHLPTASYTSKDILFNHLLQEVLWAMPFSLAAYALAEVLARYLQTKTAQFVAVPAQLVVFLFGGVSLYQGLFYFFRSFFLGQHFTGLEFVLTFSFGLLLCLVSNVNYLCRSATIKIAGFMMR